jgi:hypothetical protein
MSDESSFDLFNYQLQIVVHNYLLIIMSAIAFLTNFICFIIFIRILKMTRRGESNQMYKYLLIKSICDMLPGFFSLLLPLYECEKCLAKKTYWMQIWLIGFYYYLTSIFYMGSGAFEIVASFDCAISIENKLKWCQSRVSFIVTTGSIFIFLGSFYSYHIFTNEISVNQYSSFNNGTEVKYFIYSTVQLYTYRNLTLAFLKAERFLRDFVVLFILLIINTFILFKMIQIRKRKSRLQSTSRSSTVIMAERAENRKIKMITFLCVTFIFGHFPFIIYQLFRTFHRPWENFLVFSEIFFSFSFITPITAYYFFNKKFKLFFLKPFRRNATRSNNNTSNTNTHLTTSIF